MRGTGTLKPLEQTAVMGDSKVRCISSAHVKEINGGLPVFFGVPMMKSNSILGSILGSPYVRKLPKLGLGFSTCVIWTSKLLLAFGFWQRCEVLRLLSGWPTLFPLFCWQPCLFSRLHAGMDHFQGIHYRGDGAPTSGI